MELIKDLAVVFETPNSKRKHRQGMYICPNCLKPFKVRTSHVTSGATTQCTTCNSTKHGLSTHPLYNVWAKEKKKKK